MGWDRKAKGIASFYFPNLKARNFPFKAETQEISQDYSWFIGKFTYNWIHTSIQVELNPKINQGVYIMIFLDLIIF